MRRWIIRPTVSIAIALVVFAFASVYTFAETLEPVYIIVLYTVLGVLGAVGSGYYAYKAGYAAGERAQRLRYIQEQLTRRSPPRGEPERTEPIDDAIADELAARVLAKLQAQEPPPARVQEPPPITEPIVPPGAERERPPLVFYITVAAILVATICCVWSIGRPVWEETEPRTVDKLTQEPQETPAPTPARVSNGQVVFSTILQAVRAPLTVEASGGENYYVVLQVHGGTSRMGFYVEAGKSAEVEVPLGKYDIMYATGDIWQGADKLFGDETRYYHCSDEIFDFYYDKGTDSYMGYTLTLYPVANGNMETEEISREKFFLG